MPHGMEGVLAPVATPFGATLEPDEDRWLAHCRWLLSQGCGLAIFGTNSEANSLSFAERSRLLDVAMAAGIDPARTMPGTGGCALPEAAALTAQAVAHGCGGVLMLPPFYYKGVSEDGLFAFYSEVIQRVGDGRLNVYLYHIPQVSGVPIGHGLIERLLREYSGTVVGIKDSSGDQGNTQAMLERFDAFDVFCGSETFLLDTLRHGGAGCISATANLNPAAIVDVFRNRDAPDADERQQRVTAFRRTVERFPMIPALKAAIAMTTGDPSWSRMRPPLRELPPEAFEALAAALEEHSFAMPDR